MYTYFPISKLFFNLLKRPPVNSISSESPFVPQMVMKTSASVPAPNCLPVVTLTTYFFPGGKKSSNQKIEISKWFWSRNYHSSQECFQNQTKLFHFRPKRLLLIEIVYRNFKTTKKILPSFQLKGLKKTMTFEPEHTSLLLI